MSIAATSSLTQELMDNADERELWIVAREHEREPYFFPGKGGDTRLARAIRVCLDNRIMPNGDGSYMVEGSEHRTYRVADSCSCPNSQKAHTKWCYHMVAVAVYIEWQRRLRPVAPVNLGTLHAGTAPLPPVPDDDDLGNGYPIDDETLPLPLPPTSIDERLAAATTACVTSALQEDRMPADEYIPEPEIDEAPVAVLEPPVAPAVLTTPATSSLDAQNLLQSMAAWREQRQILARYIKEQMQDGIDYYTLRIKGRETKPMLSKAGSEKFLAIFKLTASFQQDAATWTMLGSKEGVLCYTCTLLTRDGQVVGEGRGARTLAQDQGDINKAVKMAQKSAQIDAILRTGCLSDVFTQDLEPEAAPVSAPSSADLRQTIWRLVKESDSTVTTREACEGYVKRVTGLTLEPDHYAAIVDALRGRRAS